MFSHFVKLLFLFLLVSVSAFASNPSELGDTPGSGILPASGLRFERDGIIVESYNFEVENAYQAELVAQGLASEALKDQQSVPEGEFELNIGVLEDPELESKMAISPEKVNANLISRLKGKGVKAFQVAQYGLNAPLDSVKKTIQKMSYRQKAVAINFFRIIVPTVLVSIGMSVHYDVEVAISGGFIAGLYAAPFALLNEQNADFINKWRLYKPRHLAQVREWIRTVHSRSVARMGTFLGKNWVSRVVKKHSAAIDSVPEVVNQAHGYGLAYVEEIVFSGLIARTQEIMKSYFNAVFNPATWGSLFLHGAFATTAQYPIEVFEGKYKQLAEMRGVPFETWKIGQKLWSTFGSNLSVSGIVLINSNSGDFVTAAGWGLWITLAVTGVVKSVQISKEIAMEAAKQKQIAERQKACDLSMGTYFGGDTPIDFSTEVWTEL